MRMTEQKRKASASGIRMLAILAMVFICTIAMVPLVAAGEVIDTQTLTVSQGTYYGTFDGVNYTQSSFFGVLGANAPGAGYDYTWTQHPVYSDRKPLYNLTINGQLYPPSGIPPTGWKWNIVDSLDQNAYLYKKSLAGYTSLGTHTYYLWYGNDTAARGCLNGRCDWLFPTAENATYIVQLDVTTTA